MTDEIAFGLVFRCCIHGSIYYDNFNKQWTVCDFDDKVLTFSVFCTIKKEPKPVSGHSVKFFHDFGQSNHVHVDVLVEAV